MKRYTLHRSTGFRVVFTTPRAQFAEMVLAPGAREGDAQNRHQGADQYLLVISGTGLARVNRRRVGLRAGVVLLIGQGDRHEILNTGRTALRTVNFYTPPAYTRTGTELPRGRRA